ncbi:PE-PPE domain-containing protein [Mycobacteroides saopaulense]|uniref:PE-PPE domain-containing protein n=1 Tax=Mycobacteroides saopaulense TaxID=1578165 RepID=A0ABX3C3Z6_9MYCO|nr:PE-PPE domain-containing protein [Mycobacteroides saopaulense]OHT88462.1 hypothetical protein BKG68_00625 [Mycobacteroides saopaulense]OHU13278.1 hypothetical protein BKG73_00630 [Mycobacteroides saopaulense]
MAVRYSVSGKSHSLKRSVATAAAVAATCTVLAPIAMESKTIAATLASYVIGVGGRGDGPSANIPNKLYGLDGLTPAGAQYVGVNYPGTMWPIDGIQSATFRQSVTAGHTELDKQIASHEGEDITIVGYSLGAVVVNESRRNLNDKYPDGNPNIQFVTISNAYKPNGGILARFPGIWIPFVDINSNTPSAPGLFTTTDVTNEYDTIGDFPAYFNPLAIANALVAFPYTHPDQFYDNTDLTKYDDADAIPGKTQTDGDKTTYYFADGTTKTVITNANNTKSTYYVVHTEHLPLLRPLRDLMNPIGASFVLDAIEPTLRVFIDMAYDRQISPDTVKPFSFSTPAKNVADGLKKLPGAVEQGAENFQGGLPGAAPKRPATAERPANPPASEPDPTKSTPTQVHAPTPEATSEPAPTLTAPGPTAPPAPTKDPDPTAIAVSATTGTVAAPERRPEANTDQKPKNTVKSTLRLPKLGASQPGTTPKTPKVPSLKDHLRSIPGLGQKKQSAPETPDTPSESTSSSTHTGDKNSTHNSEKHSDAA